MIGGLELINEWLNQAIEMEQSGRWRESVEIYKRMLEDDPHNSTVLCFYAMCLFGQAMYEEALDLFVQSYNHSESPDDKQTILDHILTAYYGPNADGFRLTYEQNVADFLTYEHNHFQAFPTYDELPFLCIPRNENQYYVFLKQTGQISENYIGLGPGNWQDISAKDVLMAVNVFDALELQDVEKKNADLTWTNNIKLPLYLLWESDFYLAYLQLQDFRPLLSSRRVVFFHNCESEFKEFFEDSQSIIPTKFIGISDRFKLPIERLSSIAAERNRRKETYGFACRQIAESYNRSYYEKLFGSDPGNIRILFITSRFTRVVQHSTRDFMQACQNKGMVCDLLIDKTDIHRIVEESIVEKIAQFRPNVVMMINNFRTDLPCIPEQLLCLSWVQDPSPKLHSHEYARQFSRNDLALGVPQFYKEMVKTGFDSNRLSPQHMPFNQTIFTPRSLSERELATFGADIALPSNYNLPGAIFEDLVTSICSQISDSKAKVREAMIQLLRTTYVRLGSQIENGTLVVNNAQCAVVIRNICSDLALYIGDREINEIAEIFFQRICYGLQRRAVLQWVIQDGFPIKLWGRDWEKDDLFRDYTCGLLAHGDELAKMYSATKIVLATFCNYTAHFRVFEAMACGALPMIRYVPEEYDIANIRDYFRENEHFIFYYDRADLRDKLRYYLTHEDDRRSLVERGRKRALETMTYDNVVENFMGLAKRNFVANK